MTAMFSLRRMMLGVLMTFGASAHADDPLISRLQFTATEYLIYTDQLHKLEGSACRPVPLAGLTVEKAQEQLMQRLKAGDRESFRRLFSSDMMAKLLAENTRGITALTAAEQDGQPLQLTEQQRQACAELFLMFQENLRQTEQELNALMMEYQAQSR